jgi:hypothetical protein
MMVCRGCSWVGVRDERKWGACPKCGKRRFSNDLELWTNRLAWASFVSLLAYIAARASMGA